jgi:hypothetical protein
MVLIDGRMIPACTSRRLPKSRNWADRLDWVPQAERLGQGYSASSISSRPHPPQEAARKADKNWRRRAASFSRKSRPPYWRALHLTDEAIDAFPGSLAALQPPFCYGQPCHAMPIQRPSYCEPRGLHQDAHRVLLPPSQHLAWLGGRFAMLPPLDSAHGPSYVISGILLHIGCGRVTVCDPWSVLIRNRHGLRNPDAVVCLSFTRAPAYSVTPHENAAKPACELETAPSPVGPREHLRGQRSLPKSRCCMVKRLWMLQRPHAPTSLASSQTAHQYHSLLSIHETVCGAHLPDFHIASHQPTSESGDC